MSDTVTEVAKPLYHYRMQSCSIVHKTDMRMLGLWSNNQEKLSFIRNELNGEIDPYLYVAIEDNQLGKCVYGIGKNWVWWLNNPKAERKRYRDELNQMSAFIRKNTPLFGRKNWEKALRVSCFLCRFPNHVSLRIAWLLEQIRIRLRKQKIY